MRYVSRIVTKKPGEILDSRLYNGITALKGRVVLMDTCEKGHKFANINWPGLNGVAGLAFDKNDNCKAIVVHNARTAKLHEYVEHVEVESGMAGNDYDFVVVGQQRSIRLNDGECDQIYVSVPGKAVELWGTAGSVVRVTSANGCESKLVTLYDFLVATSMASGVNLARYSTIYIYSNLIGRTVSVRFAKNDGAAVFFTKMTLEISGYMSKK